MYAPQVHRPVDPRAYPTHHAYPTQPAQPAYYAAQQPAPVPAYSYAAQSQQHYAQPSYASANPTPTSAASNQSYPSYPAPAAAPPGVDPQRWQQGKWRYTGAGPAKAAAAPPQDVGYNVASSWGVPQHYYPSNKVHKPKDPSYWATAISDNGLKLENMDNPAKSSPFDGPRETGATRAHKPPPPTPWVWEPALPGEDDGRQASSSSSRSADRAQALAQHREAFHAQKAAGASSSQSKAREETILPVEDPASRRARENAARMAPGGAGTSASAQAAAQQTDVSRSAQTNGYSSASRPSAHNSASGQAAASTRPADASRPNGSTSQSQQLHARDMQRSHTLPAPVASRPGERESKEQAEARELRTTFSPGIVRTPADYPRRKGEGGDTPRASASAGLSTSSNRAVGRSQTMPDVAAQPVAHASSAQPQRVGQHSSMPTAQSQSNTRPLGQHSSMPAAGPAERAPMRRFTVDSGSDSTERAHATKPKIGTAFTKLQHFADEPGAAGMLSPLLDSNPSLFSSSSSSSGSSTVSAGSTVRDEPQSASSSAAPSRRPSVDYADASHAGARTPHRNTTNGVVAMNGMDGRRPSVDREHPAVSREPSGSRAVSREPSMQPTDRRREPSAQPLDRRREPSVQPTGRGSHGRDQETQRQPSFGDPYRRDQAHAAQAQAQVAQVQTQASQSREQERESDREDGYHTERNRIRPSPREREREKERDREREQRESDRERSYRERSERERGRYGDRERDRSRARESGGRRASSRQPTSPTNGYYTSPNSVERSKSGDSGFVPSPISQSVSHQSTPNSSRYGTPASARQRTPSSTRGSNPPSLQPSPNRPTFPSVPYAPAQQQQQATTNHTPPQAYHPGQVQQSSQSHTRSASHQVPAQTVPAVSQPQSHHRSASQQPQYSQTSAQYAQAQPQYQSASTHAQQYSSARAKTPSPQVYANTTPAKATPPTQAYSYPTPAATPAGTPGATQPTSSASAQASAAAATYQDPRYGHSTQPNGYSTHSRSHSGNPAVPATTQPVSSASAAAAAHQQSRHRQTSGEMAAASTTKYSTPTRNTATAAATNHYHTNATPTPQQAQRSNSGGQTAAHTAQYSATPTPYRPSAAQTSSRSAAPRVRRGYWNRRGDYLTPEGYIVRAPYGRQYPSELDRYPDGDRHFRNHHGKEAKDPRYQELANGSAQYDQYIQYYS
ncbi:unnamed protein product [Peniophora sp. CBMAI 1063]|nr:unnamed protein product [Peniophora sp. CBMAI 1063]